MSKNFYICLSFLAGCGLFGYVLGQVDVAEVSQVFYLFSINKVLFLCLINFLAVIVLGGWRWKMVFKTQGGVISWGKIIQAKLAGFAVSYLTPSALIGGEPVRACILKETANTSWEKAIASVIIEQIIFFTVLFLVLSVNLILFLKILPIQAVIVSVILLFTILFLVSYFYIKLLRKASRKESFLMVVVRRAHLHKWGFIKNRLDNIKFTDSLIADFFQNHPRTLAWSVVVTLGELLFDILLIYYIIQFLGLSLNFWQSGEIFLFTTIANLTPIPAALGSFEFLTASIFQFLGSDVSSSMMFSLVFRFINVAMCLVGCVFLLLFILSTAKNNFSQNTPAILLRWHNYARTWFQNKK